MASHGFAVFAISYLYTDHLPQNLMGADDRYIQVYLILWINGATFFVFVCFAFVPFNWFDLFDPLQNTCPMFTANNI